MSQPPQLMRGAVLKCLFPFDDSPGFPGPSPHYCLLVESFTHEGRTFVIVAYGTSKMDWALENAHSHVLDIPTSLLAGSQVNDSQGVIHILCDHLAIMPLDSEWVYMNFSARLGVFKREQQMEPARKNLLAKFETAEPFLRASALALIHAYSATQKVGLMTGSTLR